MVKIRFAVAAGSDGFPPISVELINASELESGYFRIENSPFFVQEVAYHDEIAAIPSQDSRQYDYVETVQASSYTSLSILILSAEMDAFLMSLLRGLECIIEYGEFGKFRMLAVAVPGTADYSQVRSALLQLEDQELISFSELALAV